MLELYERQSVTATDFLEFQYDLELMLTPITYHYCKDKPAKEWELSSPTYLKYRSMRALTDMGYSTMLVCIPNHASTVLQESTWTRIISDGYFSGLCRP
ncbi:hypothetical protein Tco_0131269, partial [Tanacetum coccineum]